MAGYDGDYNTIPADSYHADSYRRPRLVVTWAHSASAHRRFRANSNFATMANRLKILKLHAECCGIHVAL